MEPRYTGMFKPGASDAAYLALTPGMMPDSRGQ